MPSTRPSRSSTGPPDEPEGAGAVCSIAPAIGRPARAAERTVDRRHLAPGGPRLGAAGRDGDRDVAGVDDRVRPVERWSVAGVDVEHDQVAVDVAADHRALHGPAVRESNLGGAVAKVVGVRQHPSGRDDEPGAATVAADADHGR